MRSIIPTIPKEYQDLIGDPAKISSSKPLEISSFRELVEATAKFAFYNKDHLLFFRGQSKDYLNRAGNSTFYPTIYRGDYLPQREIRNRFDILEGCSKALSSLFEDNQVIGYKDVKRRKLIQWSMLQHYEVCDTPLLDFTHSLRVACSFAYLYNTTDQAYIFMFGFPYLTNRVSLNSEHDLVNIRLLSISPPQALRPHFQEGYLTATDEITDTYDRKNELDFNNRLIVKFKLPEEGKFWSRNFHKIPKASLYPKSDPIKKLCDQIKDLASRELKSGDLGEFLKLWAELEELLTSSARKAHKEQKKYISLRQALMQLVEQRLIDKDLYYRLDRIRNFRNQVVHQPRNIEQSMILDLLHETEKVLVLLKEQFEFQQIATADVTRHPLGSG
jgi:uncharacterized protein YutE (UPF0331/DUF86 family)